MKFKNLFILAFFALFLLYANISASANNSVNKEIYLQTRRIDKSTLEVQVKGKNLPPQILGLAFDLVFNSDLLQYKSFQKGNFFEKNSNPIYLVTIDKSEKGRLISGISLKNGDLLPEGAGTFIKFYLKILKNGEASFQFENFEIVTLDSLKKSLKVLWQNSVISIDQDFNEGNSLPNQSFPIISSDIHLLIEGTLLILVVILLLYKKKIGIGKLRPINK